MMKALMPASAALALALSMSAASAKDLTYVGATLGPLGNPFYVALAKGIEGEVKKLAPNARVNIVSHDYDLNKEVTAIETMIADGAQLILVNAADSEAIAPTVKKALDAGVTVIGVDAGAKGALVNLTVDHTAAGRVACQYLADYLKHKGNIVIIDSVPMVAIQQRVDGCKEAIAQYPDMAVISADQRGDGSRDSGLKVMQTLFTRFPDIAGVFSINDQMAMGADLAAKQLGRKVAITGIDGSPEAEAALKDPDGNFVGSAAQSPFNVGAQAVQVGFKVFNGEKPEAPVILITPTIVNRDNIKDYMGWTAN
ncbi:MAG: substrate-binding domain-containing protein [Bauldia sp.]